MFGLSFFTGVQHVSMLLGELCLLFIFMSCEALQIVSISSDLSRQLMGRGFLLLYRRLFSTGISIMLRHITLPRQESMNLKMKPLRWEIILFPSCLCWLFLPAAVRALLDLGHVLCSLIAAAAARTTEMRDWRAWDKWHCMGTLGRTSCMVTLQDPYSRFWLYLP